MLETITLKFTEADAPLVIPAQGVTIFVGPNNAGKSLVLRELESVLSVHGTIETKLLQDFELAWPSETQLQEDIAKLTKKRPSGMTMENVHVGRFKPDGQLESSAVNRQSLIEQFAGRNKVWVASQFLKYFQIRLDGRTRFDLTNDRATGDLAALPQNILAHIFQDDELRKEIREIVFDAFGTFFVIDPLLGGQLRIRLSPTEPKHDEQSLGKEARAFHREATYIKEASDGVQAFVGILTAVRSGDYRSILIDEPEAFLHPPLARKLGHELATTMMKRGGSLMASTHSADFLIGCLQASPNVRVVRLEYSNGKSKGQIVDSAALSTFFKTPLIRSANVISALFHDGVVVVESDNDRAFYSEIYYRLAEQEKGYPSVLFVNAQNKQTIREIMGPLRAFGVPAAAIVDIDILKDGGATWTGWLEAAKLPLALHNGLGQVRGSLNKCFLDANKNMKTDGGVDALEIDDKKGAEDLFDHLAAYGVFVTRKGELENWLASLQVAGKKTDWTINMLDRLGADPAQPSYVLPATDDVWAFMRDIVKWIKDTGRKGTS
jgi:ABC-type polar amino acid transport system ATPase subunit